MFYFIIGVELKPYFMAAFNGNSFIERMCFKKLFESIDLIFMSQSPDGILIYVNEKLTTNFFGIKIEDNFVHFVASLNGNYQILMYLNNFMLIKFYPP